MNQAIEKRTEASMRLTSTDVIEQIQAIQDVMGKAMKNGEHYGKIPGCGDKPALLKAGAEKLGLMFRLAPAFVITPTNLQNGHREYAVTCTLTHIQTGETWGQGVGVCSTMESKYRWRKQFNETEVGVVPKAYWDTPKEDHTKRTAVLVSLFGSGKYRTKKIADAWKVFRLEGDDQRIENPDIADTYNTVLKMAKKRAHVDAIITATAASDIFTQDIEETLPEENGHPVDTEVISTETVHAPKTNGTNVRERLTAYIEAKGEGDPDAFLSGLTGGKHKKISDMTDAQVTIFYNKVKGGLEAFEAATEKAAA